MFSGRSVRMELVELSSGPTRMSSSDGRVASGVSVRPAGRQSAARSCRSVAAGAAESWPTASDQLPPVQSSASDTGRPKRHSDGMTAAKQGLTWEASERPRDAGRLTRAKMIMNRQSGLGPADRPRASTTCVTLPSVEPGGEITAERVEAHGPGDSDMARRSPCSAPGSPAQSDG